MRPLNSRRVMPLATWIGTVVMRLLACGVIVRLYPLDGGRVLARCTRLDGPTLRAEGPPVHALRELLGQLDASLLAEVCEADQIGDRRRVEAQQVRDLVAELLALEAA